MTDQEKVQALTKVLRKLIKGNLAFAKDKNSIGPWELMLNPLEEAEALLKEVKKP